MWWNENGNFSLLAVTNKEESGERKQSKDEPGITLAYGKTTAALSKVRTLERTLLALLHSSVIGYRKVFYEQNILGLAQWQFWK